MVDEIKEKKFREMLFRRSLRCGAAPSSGKAPIFSPGKAPDLCGGSIPVMPKKGGAKYSGSGAIVKTAETEL